MGKGQKDAVPLMVAVRLFRFAFLLLPLLLSGGFGAFPARLRMFSTRLRVIRNRFWMTRLLSHRMWRVSRTPVSSCFARVRFGSGSLQISFVPL